MEKLFLTLGFLAFLFLYSLQIADLSKAAVVNDSIQDQTISPLQACPPSLAQGSTKTDWVSSLQHLLQNRGFLLPNMANQGHFGLFTKKAVRAFQGSQGLNITGMVGPETWAKLGKCHHDAQQIIDLACPMTLNQGAQTTWVRTLQRTLQARGFFIEEHNIDGIFGPYTKAAVQAFQLSQNLKNDGVVRSDTWERLGVCKYYSIR